MLQKLFPRTIPPHPNLGTLARAWCSPSLAPSAAISLLSLHPEALSSTLPCPGGLGDWSSRAPREPGSINPRPQKSPCVSPLAPCALRSGWSQGAPRRSQTKSSSAGSGMGSGDPRGQRDPRVWAQHPPRSGKPGPGHGTRGLAGEGAGGAALQPHHRLLDLVVDGHHAGSGGAARERRGRGSGPKTSLAQGSVHRDTSPHRASGRPLPKGIRESGQRSRVSFAPGAAMPRHRINRGSQRPRSPGPPFPRISAANGGGTAAHRGCPYLLSSFTETTSPPSREEKKEMEKLWSW